MTTKKGDKFFNIETYDGGSTPLIIICNFSVDLMGFLFTPWKLKHAVFTFI